MRKFVENLPSVNCTTGVMDCYTIFNSVDIVMRVSLTLRELIYEFFVKLLNKNNISKIFKAWL